MLFFALKNLLRRPFRNGLALAALSISVATLACLLAFGQGYRRALHTELDRTGVQMMVVPLGCPYDAAARVLKGKTLDNSLPFDALKKVRRDPAVAVAAPLLLTAIPRLEEGRTDLWAGLDKSALELRPWWKAKLGKSWFSGDDSVILGDEAAQVETREPGDKFFSPETQTSLRVTGILERSGTSDDSLFFVPLATAQKMFHQEGRLTAIAIRLHDPSQYAGAVERLQAIPGAQVVTLSEIMGTFLNLVGTVRMLLLSVATVAITISVLGVFNTQLTAVVERTNELSLMRAFGASRSQVFGLVALESLIMVSVGSLCGLMLSGAMGQFFEELAKRFVPFSPEGAIFTLTGQTMMQCGVLGVCIGLLAGIYPAWQASRMQPANALKGEDA